jgi:hypothetical protein
LGNDQEVGKRINVPDIVNSKWDEMVSKYNNIVARVNQKSSDQHQLMGSFKTRYGTVVNLNDFASRMESILYKLRWAANSLAYLIDFHERYAKSLDDSMRGMVELIPDTFIFNADVFFSFSYSALDIVGGIIDTVVETGIEKRWVYFTTVLEFLSSPKSPFAGSLLSDLKNESDAGWIHEFRLYRIFVTHHAAIKSKSHFKYTASDQTIEINLFMLPDDPLKTPPTHEKRRELALYCQETFVKELEVMKVLFEFLENLI